MQPPTLVLSIDQGEELFAADGKGEALPFLALLRELLLFEVPKLIVLCTIRSDAYDQLQTVKELEGIKQETYSLPPMPHGAYRTIIEGPAIRLNQTNQKKLTIDPNLTERLLRDIEQGGGKDTLPLLAFTLERLYIEYGELGHLSLQNYEEMDGLKGAVAAAVERFFKAAESERQLPFDRTECSNLLRKCLIPWLAGIDPDTRAACRRIAKLADIPSDAKPLVDLLIKQRLLTIDLRTESGEATIEPAHEALLRQWDLLQGWLKEDFVALTVLEGVQRSARDWLSNNKDPAWLNHTAARLVDAEQLKELSDLVAILKDSDWDYLKACRERDDQRKDKELQEVQKLESERAVAVAARSHAEDLIQFMIFDLQEKLKPIGQLDLLDMVSRKALEYFKQFSDPSAMFPKQQRHLSVLMDNFGDVLVAQGNLEDALAAYHEAREIRKRLIELDLENADWQRDLALSHDNIGDVLMEKDDLPGALDCYQEAMEIRKRLTEQDPKNADWQSDFSLSHNNIGDVLMEKDDLNKALDSYQEAMKIRKRLTERDPKNVDWQRNLAVSHNRIGDVLMEKRDPSGALASYREDMEIMKRLAEQDPNNVNLQRDLSVCHERIGDVLMEKRDPSGALASYQEDMAISKRLADLDSKNAVWQRDLAESHEKIGDALTEEGDHDAAIHNYQQEIAIIEEMFNKFPDQKSLPFDLSNPYGMIGRNLIQQGKFVKGEKNTLKAYELDPKSWEWSLNLGHAHLLQGDEEKAYQYYREAVTLIPDDTKLETGPVEDCKFFINKGWKVTEFQQLEKWFAEEYQLNQAKKKEAVAEPSKQ